MNRARRSSGFSLVEVTVALAVISFALLSLLALMSIGVTSDKETLQKTHASSLLSEIAPDLRAPLVSGKSPRFGFDPTSTAPESVYFDNSDAPAGTYPYPGNNSTASSIFRVTVTFPTPSTNLTGKIPTVVLILVTWPALADPQPTLAPINYQGIFETSTAIDRN